MSRLVLLLAVLAALASGCGLGAKALRVIHTTDVHGFFSAGPEDGGVERLAALVDAERRAGHVILLVDSGDMWSGTLLSDRTEGALGVALYNALGYDAAALGNHEFDYGPLGPAREGGAEPFGALAARIAEARFPILAANLVDKLTGRLPDWENLHASVMVDRGGFKVGLIGVLTPTTPSITFPHVGNNLRFEDPVLAVERETAKLRRAGAELVYVLAHLGGDCRGLTPEHDLSHCKEESELFRLAQRLLPGSVDGIFGGHSNSLVRHRVNGIPVLQAGHHGDMVSTLDVRQVSGEKPRSVLHDPKVLRGPAKGPLAATVRELLDAAEEETRALRAEELGARVVEPLTRDRRRSSQLGTWLCDVLLAAHGGADVCLLNSGGLREDLPAGPITYGTLYDIMPFGNMVAELRVSGTVLRELLRLGTTGAHGVLQVAGVQVQYDQRKDLCPTKDRDGDGRLDVDDRDRLLAVRDASGGELDPDRTYVVVTNSFMARGGDGFRRALQGLPEGSVRVLTDGVPVRDMIAGWLRRERPIVNTRHRPVMIHPRVVAIGEPLSVRCH